MAKGSDFERTICKELSQWWSREEEKKERDDVFWRTAGSGARATVRQKQGKDTSASYGDVTSIDPIGYPFVSLFLLEIKRGYTSFRQVKDQDITNILLLLKKSWIALPDVTDKLKRLFTKSKKSGMIDVLELIDRGKGDTLLLQWWKEAEEKRAKTDIPFTLLIFKRDRKKTVVMFNAELIRKLEEASGDNYLGDSLFFHQENGLSLVLTDYELFFSWLSTKTVKLIAEEEQQEISVPSLSTSSSSSSSRSSRPSKPKGKDND